MKTALTPKTIYAVTVPTSEGVMYALSGKTKAARAALVERYGNPAAGGCHIVTAAEAVRLRDELRAA